MTVVNYKTMIMNKILYFFLFMVLMMYSAILISQNDSTYIHFLPKPPEAQQMELYGNISDISASGAPNITIPLHKVNVEGFQLPFSINYLATGIKAKDEASAVGLKWALNAGGNISRNIFGLPDEKNGASKAWFAHTDSELDSLLNECNDSALTPYYENYYSALPDLFHYNIAGESGKFIFDNNQNLHKLESDDVKIEFRLTDDHNTLTDAKGNRYHFEKNNGAEETTVWSHATRDNYDQMTEGINNWKVSQIVTNKGKEINFYYSSYVFNRNFVFGSYEYVIREHKTTGIRFDTPTAYYKSYRYNLALVDSITTDKELIVFTYNNDSAYSGMSRFLKNMYVVSKLDKDTIKHIRFDYEPYNGDPRLKLTKVQIIDIPIDDSSTQEPYVYNFYYDNQALPVTEFWKDDFDGYRQDVFGYINNNSVPHMIPTGNFEIIEGGGNDGTDSLIYDDNKLDSHADRNINSIKIKSGILTKITYPTGGSTIFEYEPNKAILEGGQEVFFPGLRVRKTYDLDENESKYNEKVFNYYEPDFDQVHIADMWNRFKSEGQPVCHIYNLTKYSSNPYINIFPGKYHSKGFYKQVEIHMENNGKITKKYNQGLNMNYYITERAVHNDNEKIIEKSSYFYLDTLDVTIDDIYAITGRPFPCSSYKCDGLEYGNPMGEGPPVIKYPSLSQLSVTFPRKHLQIEQEHVEYYYDNNEQLIDSLILKEKYTYNEFGLITRIEKQIIGDKTLITKNKYVSDYNYEQESYNDLTLSILTDMYHDHHIGVLIETQQWLEKEGQINFVNGKINLYKNENEIFVPSEIYLARLEEPTHSIVETSIDISNEVFQMDDVYQKEVAFKEYDIESNLIEYQIENRIPVSFLYGYNYTLPIAKIENTTHPQVSTALSLVGYTVEDLQTKTDSELRFVFNQLRNELPDAMVTSYTHKPLIGVTSITDPRGQTQFYEYDGMNRLIRIKDHEGNIVEEYEYNYVNQQ